MQKVVGQIIPRALSRNFNLLIVLTCLFTGTCWGRCEQNVIETDEEQLGQTFYNFGYDSLLQLHFGSFGIGLSLDFISTVTIDNACN